MEDTQNLNDETKELIEKLHEGKMLSYPMIKRLVDRALTTGDSGPLREYIRKYRVFEAQARRNIALANYQQLDNPFRPYPSREDAQLYLSGPLKLGFINELDDMFGIHQDIFCLPTIIPGRVGSGKSMLLKYLLNQMLSEENDSNSIIPDLKLEYRDLLSFTPRLKVLTNDRIKINPLQIPNWMTPSEYIVFFSKVLSRENWVGAISENIIRDELEYLYRMHGIFDGNDKNYPTLKDLHALITHRLEKQKSFSFRDILLKVQGMLKSNLIHKAFDCRIGIPHDIWRKENIVLEMDSGFTDHMYSFTISYIAGLRYTYNKKMRLMGSVLRSLLLVDEGRILFSSARDVEAYGESYISEIITKCREFGLGFLVASPESESFNQTLKAISFLKVCFPLTDGNEKSAIKESFGLDDEQADYLFKLPRYGKAIVRYGGYEKPFLLAVPHFRIKKHLTDEEVEERMSGFYNDLDDRIKRSKSRPPIYTIERVPPAASALLHCLHNEPFTKTSDMNFSVFKSDAEVKKALDWLEKNEFIHREKYQTSKRGRKSIFAVLNNKAYQYLKKKGIPGRGSFEHSLYQHNISEWHNKNGTEAKIEGRIGKGNIQKSVDVLFQSEDRGTVAYEVTLHFENLLDNLHQDLAAGADEVVVVTRDQKDLEKAIGIVNKDESLNPHLEKIAFRNISEFFS